MHQGHEIKKYQEGSKEGCEESRELTMYCMWAGDVERRWSDLGGSGWTDRR